MQSCALLAKGRIRDWRNLKVSRGLDMKFEFMRLFGKLSVSSRPENNWFWTTAVAKDSSDFLTMIVLHLVKNDKENSYHIGGFKCGAKATTHHPLHGRTTNV